MITKPKHLDDIAAPAKIEPGHVRDRAFRDDRTGHISNRLAWRKLTPLQLAYYKNQLAGGSGTYASADRLAAGLEYARLCDLEREAGRDSTSALTKVSGSSRHTNLTDARADAVRKLALIDGAMGARDRRIIRMVCGDGFWPSQAVREVCGLDYTKAVSARLREALDALIEAVEKAHDNRRARHAL